MKSIESSHDVTSPSAGALTAAGMTRVGRGQHMLYHDPGWNDVDMYSQLNSSASTADLEGDADDLPSQCDGGSARAP
eukprot:m.160174 g.160174  ORF g.160174 m.160174 type:complete len:77 (-) comp18014_c0_seq11:1134-1364(-)